MRSLFSHILETTVPTVAGGVVDIARTAQATAAKDVEQRKQQLYDFAKMEFQAKLDVMKKHAEQQGESMYSAPGSMSSVAPQFLSGGAAGAASGTPLEGARSTTESVFPALRETPTKLGAVGAFWMNYDGVPGANVKAMEAARKALEPIIGQFKSDTPFNWEEGRRMNQNDITPGLTLEQEGRFITDAKALMLYRKFTTESGALPTKVETFDSFRRQMSEAAKKIGTDRTMEYAVVRRGDKVTIDAIKKEVPGAAKPATPTASKGAASAKAGADASKSSPAATPTPAAAEDVDIEGAGSNEFGTESARDSALISNDRAGVLGKYLSPGGLAFLNPDAKGALVGGAVGAAPGDVPRGPVMDQAKELIKKNEGKPFLKVGSDSKTSDPLIGYGFNLSRPDAEEIIGGIGLDIKDFTGNGPKGTITKKQADILLDVTMKKDDVALRSIFKSFDAIPDNVKASVMDMIYNMGETKFRKFTGTIDAINAGKYDEAAKRIRGSEYYKQVTSRAEQNAKNVEGSGSVLSRIGGAALEAVVPSAKASTTQPEQTAKEKTLVPLPVKMMNAKDESLVAAPMPVVIVSQFMKGVKQAGDRAALTSVLADARKNAPPETMLEQYKTMNEGERDARRMAVEHILSTIRTQNLDVPAEFVATLYAQRKALREAVASGR